MLKLKRTYDPRSKDDGTRILVERLWPRGLTKAQLPVGAWVTLVYSSHDTEHNNAVALQEYLQRKLSR